jgi:hypothetical protein
MATTFQKSLAAAALGAVGMVTGPALAQALPAIPAPQAPACTQYGFSGNVEIDYGGGGVTFSANGTTASGPATYTSDKGGESKGTISGGITGGRLIALSFQPDDGGAAVRFDGTVGDDGVGTGRMGVTPWRSLAPFTCLDAAAPANPQGMAEVTGDVDMYDKPGGDGTKYPGWLEGGEGQTVQLITCQPDNWCNVVAPDGRSVWVWGEFIKH